MIKAKRVLALLGVILLVAMYGSTLVFAVIDSPMARGLLMGSVYCTIAVPVLLYAMTLVTKHLKDKNQKLHEEEEKRKDDFADDDNAGD